MSFHHWMSTDSETVEVDAETIRTDVSCLLCGVTAPEWGYGHPYFISVAHGAMPLWCPGNSVENPHEFLATGGEDDPIECYHCSTVIGGETLPDSVEWECPYNGE